MKKQLIYHTHVNTHQEDKIQVTVQSTELHASCYLNRISRDGLTLSCDAQTLQLLMPNKASVAPKDPISLKTLFHLSEDVEALCRVVFARRLSKDQFIMELKFVDISAQHMSAVNEFIEKQLSPYRGKQTQDLTSQQASLYHKETNAQHDSADTKKELSLVQVKNNGTLNKAA